MLSHEQNFGRLHAPPQADARKASPQCKALAVPVGPAMPAPPALPTGILGTVAAKRTAKKKPATRLQKMVKTGKLPTADTRRPTIGPLPPGKLPSTYGDPQPSHEQDLLRKLAALTRRNTELENAAKSHDLQIEGHVQAHAATITGWTAAYEDLANKYNTLLMTCNIHMPKTPVWDLTPLSGAQLQRYYREIYDDKATAARRHEDENKHWDALDVAAPLPVDPRGLYATGRGDTASRGGGVVVAPSGTGM